MRALLTTNQDMDTDNVNGRPGVIIGIETDDSGDGASSDDSSSSGGDIDAPSVIYNIGTKPTSVSDSLGPPLPQPPSSQPEEAEGIFLQVRTALWPLHTCAHVRIRTCPSPL